LVLANSDELIPEFASKLQEDIHLAVEKLETAQD